jgi:hypothetical protein
MCLAITESNPQCSPPPNKNQWLSCTVIKVFLRKESGKESPHKRLKSTDESKNEGKTSTMKIIKH